MANEKSIMMHVAIIDVMTEMNKSSSYYNITILDIKELARTINYILFMFIPRKRNTVAHYIVRRPDFLSIRHSS